MTASCTTQTDGEISRCGCWGWRLTIGDDARGDATDGAVKLIVQDPVDAARLVVVVR